MAKQKKFYKCTLCGKRFKVIDDGWYHALCPSCMYARIHAVIRKKEVKADENSTSAIDKV